MQIAQKTTINFVHFAYCNIPYSMVLYTCKIVKEH
nr:MAG TPA: hypothetical protein [Caudoviricetes sp.]